MTSRDPEQSTFDPLGSVLSVIGLGALLFGIIEGPERGWSNAMVMAGFGIGAVVMASFVMWERHTPTPMLDAAPRATATVSMLLVEAALTTMFATL